MPQLRPALDGVGAPTGPPSPRAALFWDGTYWRMGRVDAHGRVQVRGEDQLFSYKQSLLSLTTAVISGAGGYIDCPTPAAGLLWKILNIKAVDGTSATTLHRYHVRRGVVNYQFHELAAAFGVGDNSYFHGEVWLEPGDVVRIYFTGALAADTCYIEMLGCIMTLET